MERLHAPNSLFCRGSYATGTNLKRAKRTAQMIIDGGSLAWGEPSLTYMPAIVGVLVVAL